MAWKITTCSVAPKVIKFRTLILNYLNNWGQGIKFTRRARCAGFAGGLRKKIEKKETTARYKKDEKKSQAKGGRKTKKKRTNEETKIPLAKSSWPEDKTS